MQNNEDNIQDTSILKTGKNTGIQLKQKNPPENQGGFLKCYARTIFNQTYLLSPIKRNNIRNRLIKSR